MKPLTCPKTSFCTLVLLFFLCLGTAAVQATDTGGSKDTAKKPGSLHVTSDKLIAEQGNSMVEFIGSVRAVRDDAVLLADSVKVFFKSDDKADDKARDKAKTDEGDKGQSNVEKIIATGHVEYTAGERKAFADKAVYTAADEKLVLTGNNPRVLTGKSWVAGRKITLFRLEERVMVESDGKKRVQAFFDAQDQGQDMAGKKDGSE